MRKPQRPVIAKTGLKYGEGITLLDIDKDTLFGLKLNQIFLCPLSH